MSTKINDILNAERLGSYQPNRFLVTLGDGTPFFNINDNGEVSSNQNDYLAVYIHEYWHYLQNVTTIAGVAVFFLMQELAALFSRTLEESSSGEINSKGSTGFEPADQESFDNVMAMFNAMQGTMKPARLRANPIKDWAIQDMKKEEVELTWRGKRLIRHQLVLKFTINYSNGATDTSAQLQVGAGSIQESIAYLVERHLGSKDSSLKIETSPPFPYTVLEKIIEHVVGSNNDPLDIIASIGTLSLMSNNPAAALYDFVVDYGTYRRSGTGPFASLNRILQRSLPSIHESFNTVLAGDLFSIETMHTGRGLVEKGAKYIVAVIRKAMQRRLEHPLFDLDFSTKNTPKQVIKSINKLLSHFPPCDVLQEMSGKLHDVMRDFLGTSHPIPMQNDFQISDGIRALQSQQHFMLRHLRTKGFVPTNVAVGSDSRCPYYTVCNLHLRQNSASICDSAPWKHWRKADGPACWYTTGVAGTAGLVTIKT